MKSKLAGETAGAPLLDCSRQFGRSTAKIHWLAFADELHLRSVHEGIFFPKQPLPIISTKVKSTPQAVDATFNGTLPALQFGTPNINRTAVVSNISHREHSAVSDDRQRFIFRSDKATSHACHYTVFKLYAADGQS